MVNRHYTAGWMRAFAPKSGCCAAWAPLDPPRRASTPLIPAPDFFILPDGFLVIDLRGPRELGREWGGSTTRTRAQWLTQYENRLKHSD